VETENEKVFEQAKGARSGRNGRKTRF